MSNFNNSQSSEEGVVPSNPPGAQPAENKEEINLLDLVEVLVKRWRLIIGSTLGTMVLMACYMLTQPGVYTAKTLVLPANDSSGVSSMMSQLGGVAALVGASVGSTTTADLYVAILKSEPLRDAIIDHFKLQESLGKKNRSEVYRVLNSKVSIGIGKKDGILSIEVDDADPKFAAEMANTYVAELGRHAALLGMNSAGSNSAFFEKQLVIARTDLTKAEEQFKDFQLKNKTMSVTDQGSAAFQEVARLQAELTAKEVELAVLRGRYTENSQEVKTISAAIANLRGQIRQRESGASSGAALSVGSLPHLGQEYFRLMRELKIKESVIEALTKQYEMAKISSAKDTPPFQLLQMARVPDEKSKPNRKKSVLVSGAVAFCSSVFLAFLLNYLEHMPSADRSRLREIRSHLPFAK